VYFLGNIRKETISSNKH